MTGDESSAGTVHCPNCNTEDTRHDLSQDGFDEYRCGNDNCRVEVFRVNVE